MSFRPITKAQAEAILQILKEECGYSAHGRDGEAFVSSIETGPQDGLTVCREYRFMGALGFGGKFRNNGNHHNTPYVDLYQEDETNERANMVIRANNRIAALFVTDTGTP